MASDESKVNSSHPPKQGNQSGGKDNSSGNFMTSLKNVFSGKRGDPPKLPFKAIHVEILCKEKEVWAELLQELHLTKKWKEICIKEEDQFLRVEKMLEEWWDSLHDCFTGELLRFTDTLRIHRLHDLADHIQQAPESAVFHVSVVDAVAHTAKGRWNILTSHLPIEQHDLNGKLQQSYSSYAKFHLVFHIWQQKESGCLKIWKLIDACRKTGIEDVAADIEQGLSENYCRTLSRQIEKPQWKGFGEKLSISETRLDAFGLKFHNVADRVFHMLCYWSMTCPFNTDKKDVLAEALRSCKEENLANELQRDLCEEDLQMTAALIDTDWKGLASHLSQYDVEDIMQRGQRPVEKALLVMKIWKRRQSLENKKLKMCFCTFLLEKKFYKAAIQLYDDSTRSLEWEYANTKEIAQKEERQKTLMKEVTDLQDQLVIMKTKYADTVKSLEEGSQKMNSFELKYAELESELHQTKHDQASNQEEVERLKKELEGYKKQTRLENETGKKLTREVTDLQGQLEIMKTKYADAVKRLEEESQKMNSFELKNAELESELHQTKHDQAFYQEEVERLKKELDGYKKQTRLENEPGKETAKGYSEDASPPVTTRESRNASLEDFGKFQFHLSSYLTRDIIRDLTLVLAFSPTESEQAEDDKIKFIRLLRGKGLISPADITPLTNALYQINQRGVWDAVKNSFQRNQSEAFT